MFYKTKMVKSTLSKAQTFSLDFFIALTIFLIGFSILMIFWNYVNSQTYEIKSSEELMDLAFSLSEIFFIEGVPKYWNEENVKVIGLANENRINETKLNLLNTIGYENVKRKLNLDFDFMLKIKNDDELYSFGLTPGRSSTIVKINRIGILNSTPVLIEVILWK